MNWRDIIKNNTSDTYIQKVQNIQKVEKKTFAPFVPFAGGSKKLKKSCWTCSHLSLDALPGLCKWITENKPIPVALVDKGCKNFKPDISVMKKHVSRLWNHAHRMADFTDESNAPYKDRKALVPAIFSIGKIIDEIEGE